MSKEPLSAAEIAARLAKIKADLDALWSDCTRGRLIMRDSVGTWLEGRAQGLICAMASIIGSATFIAGQLAGRDAKAALEEVASRG